MKKITNVLFSLCLISFAVNGVQSKLDLTKLTVKTSSITVPTDCDSYIVFDKSACVVPENFFKSKIGALNETLQGKNFFPQFCVQEKELIVKILKDEKNNQSCTVLLQSAKDPYGDETISFKCPTPNAVHTTINTSYILLVMPKGSLIKNFLIKNPFFVGN